MLEWHSNDEILLEWGWNDGMTVEDEILLEWVWNDGMTAEWWNSVRMIKEWWNDSQMIKFF